MLEWPIPSPPYVRRAPRSRMTAAGRARRRAASACLRRVQTTASRAVGHVSAYHFTDSTGILAMAKRPSRASRPRPPTASIRASPRRPRATPPRGARARVRRLRLARTSSTTSHLPARSPSCALLKPGARSSSRGLPGAAGDLLPVRDVQLTLASYRRAKLDPRTARTSLPPPRRVELSLARADSTRGAAGVRIPERWPHGPSSGGAGVRAEPRGRCGRLARRWWVGPTRRTETSTPTIPVGRRDSAHPSRESGR